MGGITYNDNLKGRVYESQDLILTHSIATANRYKR